jgi:hypothetical protein
MNIRERPSRGQIITIALLALVVLLVGWTTVDRLADRESRQVAEEELQLAEDNAASLAAQIRVECEQRSVIAVELGDLCRQAEAVEEAPTQVVPVPPTDSQLMSVLRNLCGDCRGPRGFTGFDGRDGQDGTDGQDGADGADGTDGAPGVDGQDGASGATGERGPSCVEELGLDACRGDQGEPGPACPNDQEATLVEVRIRGGDERFVDAWLCIEPDDPDEPPLP